jgi:hypothetical protein
VSSSQQETTLKNWDAISRQFSQLPFYSSSEKAFQALHLSIHNMISNNTTLSCTIIQDMDKGISTAVTETKKFPRQDSLLKSMRYEGMNSHSNSIMQARTGTFELADNTMTNSVNDEPAQDPCFSSLQQQKSIYRQMVAESVDRYYGDLLWTPLAIKALNTTDGKGIHPRRERICGFTSGWEVFLQQVLESVKTQRTAAILCAMFSTRRPLSLLVCSSIGEELPSIESECMRTHRNDWNHGFSDDLRQAEMEAERQIDACFKGLLVCQDREESLPGRREVYFSDVKLRDFLQTPTGHQLLHSNLDPAFSTDLSMCKAYLCVAKKYPGSLSKDDLADVLHHGQLAEQECRDKPDDDNRKASLENVLDEINRACRVLNGTARIQPDTFAGQALMYYVTTHIPPARDIFDDQASHHFYSLRADSGYDLHKVEMSLEFTDSQLTEGTESPVFSNTHSIIAKNQHYATPKFLQRENGAALALIMEHAVESFTPIPMFNEWSTLVKLLLRSGADPNLKSDSTGSCTPFEIFVDFYFRAFQEPSVWSQWIDAFPIFLQYGADMNVLFPTSSARPCWYSRFLQIPSEHTRAEEIFIALFDHGLDPNKCFRHTTIWAHFLQNILGNRTWNPQGVREYNSRSSQIYRTAKIFVQNGALLSSVIRGNLEDTRASKQAWEALWPYGQEMQDLLKESKSEPRPPAFESWLRRK